VPLLAGLGPHCHGEHSFDHGEGIIDYQGDALDDQYIIDWLKQFEAALDDSTLIETYKRMRRKK
jgi:hypothetical protein